MAKSKKRKADSSGSKTNNDASNIPEKRSKALVNVQNKVAASSLGNVTLEKAKEKSKPRSDSKLKGKNRDNRQHIMQKKKGKKQEQKKPVILTNKEAHAKLKTLRVERRQKDKSHYELTLEMKKIWEELRKHDLPKDQREQLCQQMMKLVTGKERDFVFAHDTARIFETLCKYAPVAMRSVLFLTLKDSILEMTRSTYSVFLVKSLLRLGTKQERSLIIDKLMKDAQKLISHKTAGPVVELAYNEYANAEQRLVFSQQFYGPPVIWQISDGFQPLEKLLEQKPDKKDMILKYMRDSLQSIVQKEVLSFTCVHHLLFEYMKFAGPIDKQAMAECLQEHLPLIVHTRDGAKAAVYTVWCSSAKGRKTIMKKLKPYLDTLIKEEYGHLVLLAMFDSVDDTKLLAKLIIQPICEKLDEFVQVNWARKVIIYLLSPRNPSHCNKEVREFLALGDENPFSKKDPKKRQQELRDEFYPQMVAYAATNLNKFTSDDQLCLVLGHILTVSPDKPSDLTDAIIRAYAVPYAPNSQHILESMPMKTIRSKMLKGDQSGVICNRLVESLSEETVASYLTCNSGKFLLAGLLNTLKDDSVGEAKDDLRVKITKHEKELRQLEKADDKASQLLLNALGTSSN